MAEVSRSRAGLRLGALALLLIGGVLLLRLTPVGELLSRQGALGVIEYLRSSAWAPVLFVILYTAAVALAMPGTILTLTGGAVFGFWGGFLLNSIGANLGANLAFLLSRSLGRGGIRRLLRGEHLQRHMRRLDAVAERHGFRGLLILRLIPAVPFNALNFGPGLTAMPWRAYAGATVLGIIPGTAVYTLFADALLEGSQAASREAFGRVLLAGVLLVVLSLVPVILRKLKISLPGAAGALALCGCLAAPAKAGSESLPAPREREPVAGRAEAMALADSEHLAAAPGEPGRARRAPDRRRGGSAAPAPERPGGGRPR